MAMVTYDVAIIGGGVVGCAVLNELTEQGLSCILCERNSDLLAEASSGNSGIVHTGYDALPGSTEWQCLKQSRQLNQECYRKFNIPYKQIGATIVAWNKEQLAQLPSIVEQAHKNGVPKVFQLSREQLQEKEPNLSHDALGAVCIPEEGVVDSWLFPVMMAHTAKQQGAKISLNCNLLNGSQDNTGCWTLITNTGHIKARAVVNCAGLHGDTVEKINSKSPFKIFPCKGQYVVYDENASSLVNSIILPVPTRKTKGIIIFPSVYGNLVVGPTSEDQPSRDKWPINIYTSHSLESYALRILPSLAKHSTVMAFAGLRPGTQYRDYQLQTHKDRNWITVGGIRSTGLSACTGLAKYVSNQLQKELGIFPHISSSNHAIAMQDTQSSAGDIAMEQNQEEESGENDNSGKVDRVNPGYLALEGASYRITHPLSRLGLDSVSKL